METNQMKVCVYMLNLRRLLTLYSDLRRTFSDNPNVFVNDDNSITYDPRPWQERRSTEEEEAADDHAAMYGLSSGMELPQATPGAGSSFGEYVLC